MCDEHTLKSEGEGVGVTRRQFSKMTTTTALAMTIPAVANAKTVTAQDVTIETADGVCDALFVRPSEGKHPAVLIWPDILALRPSFREMAGAVGSEWLFGSLYQSLLSELKVSGSSGWRKFSGRGYPKQDHAYVSKPLAGNASNGRQRLCRLA